MQTKTELLAEAGQWENDGVYAAQVGRDEVAKRCRLLAKDLRDQADDLPNDEAAEG